MEDVLKVPNSLTTRNECLHGFNCINYSIFQLAKVRSNEQLLFAIMWHSNIISEEDKKYHLDS